jgi:hypothetical protein
MTELLLLVLLVLVLLLLLQSSAGQANRGGFCKFYFLGTCALCVHDGQQEF